MASSVEAFLEQNDLGQYVEIFKDAGFDDLETFYTVNDEDLKELKLPLGHRKKLLMRLAALTTPSSDSQQSVPAGAQPLPRGIAQDFKTVLNSLAGKVVRRPLSKTDLIYTVSGIGDGQFQAVLRPIVIDEAKKFIGDVCATEKDAEQSAAKKAVEYFSTRNASAAQAPAPSPWTLPHRPNASAANTAAFLTSGKQAMIRKAAPLARSDDQCRECWEVIIDVLQYNEGSLLASKILQQVQLLDGPNYKRHKEEVDKAGGVKKYIDCYPKHFEWVLPSASGPGGDKIVLKAPAESQKKGQNKQGGGYKGDERRQTSTPACVTRARAASVQRSGPQRTPGGRSVTPIRGGRFSVDQDWQKGSRESENRRDEDPWSDGKDPWSRLGARRRSISRNNSSSWKDGKAPATPRLSKCRQTASPHASTSAGTASDSDGENSRGSSLTKSGWPCAPNASDTPRTPFSTSPIRPPPGLTHPSQDSEALPHERRYLDGDALSQHEFCEALGDRIGLHRWSIAEKAPSQDQSLCQLPGAIATTDTSTADSPSMMHYVIKALNLQPVSAPSANAKARATPRGAHHESTARAEEIQAFKDWAAQQKGMRDRAADQPTETQLQVSWQAELKAALASNPLQPRSWGQ